MQANSQILLKRLNKIQTIAAQLLQECAISKEMLADVSTSANARKGNKPASVKVALIKRRVTILKKKQNKKAVL